MQEIHEIGAHIPKKDEFEVIYYIYVITIL